MRLLRVLGGAALLGAAFWFDTVQANRWISTFLIVAGGSLLLLGPAWFMTRTDGERTWLGIRYRYRMAAATLAGVAAVWFLVSDQLATSAVTTCIALALLTYQAPWLPSATREDHPAPTP